MRGGDVGLPYVTDQQALPALLERLHSRAPDSLYTDTLEACGFDATEYRNVNSLLYFLNFFLPGSVDGPQRISAFWREQYYQAREPRAALGWMLLQKYAVLYDRLPNWERPSKSQVLKVLASTRLVAPEDADHINDIAATFITLNKWADVAAGKEFASGIPPSFLIYGVMPKEDFPPTFASIITTMPKPLLIGGAIFLLFCLIRCQADPASFW